MVVVVVVVVGEKWIKCKGIKTKKAIAFMMISKTLHEKKKIHQFSAWKVIKTPQGLITTPPNDLWKFIFFFFVFVYLCLFRTHFHCKRTTRFSLVIKQQQQQKPSQFFIDEKKKENLLDKTKATISSYVITPHLIPHS